MPGSDRVSPRMRK
ncbi:UNVERIFIED_CONTAM: hypothetical protein GTU68_039619 [Idotea baltica]|nr:hypothetical protein [Idotea baltica]